MNTLQKIAVGVVLLLALVGGYKFFSKPQMQKCVDYFHTKIKNDIQLNEKNEELLKNWCSYLIKNGVEF